MTAASASDATNSFREPVRLGRTGLQVSRLGIGSSYGVGADDIVRAHREHGVNYLYWGAVRRGGMKQAIRQLASERDRLVIALQSYDRTGLLMGPMLERGLKALRIDHADLLILGWYNGDPARRILDAALELKARGRVRHLALSGHHRPYFAELAGRADCPYDVFMLRYNAAHRGAEREIFPHLSSVDTPGRCGVIAFTATCWGKLLKPASAPPGETPLSAADCYRFALTSPKVDLCICGPANRAEMDEALLALERGPLSDEELQRARRIGDHVHG